MRHPVGGHVKHMQLKGTRTEPATHIHCGDGLTVGDQREQTHYAAGNDYDGLP